MCRIKGPPRGKKEARRQTSVACALPVAVLCAINIGERSVTNLTADRA